MDKKRMIQLEAAITVAWFFMDVFWKNDHSGLANGFAFLAVSLMSFALAFGLKTYDTKELYAQAATGAWLLMNVSWMLSETNPMFDIIADVFMWVGTVMIALMFVFFGDALDVFRRFKVGKK